MYVPLSISKYSESGNATKESRRVGGSAAAVPQAGLPHFCVISAGYSDGPKRAVSSDKGLSGTLITLGLKGAWADAGITVSPCFKK